MHRAMARTLSTKAIFVSELLKSRCLAKDDFRPVQIIPSAASPKLFSFSDHNRQVCRERLGIRADQIVFIYAGSIAYYQCFDESVALFRRILRKCPHAVLLVLTPNEEHARQAVGDLLTPSVRLISAPIDEVNGYLNAADYGLFLRKQSPVNDVASPVKFSEYCLAGLPVLMTDAVKQSIEIGNRFGNVIKVDIGGVPEHLPSFSNEKRAEISREAASMLGRTAMVPRYLKLYGVADVCGAPSYE